MVSIGWKRKSSNCTSPTKNYTPLPPKLQSTRGAFVIVLVGWIQKSGTRYHNLANGQERSRTDQIWTIFVGSAKYSEMIRSIWLLTEISGIPGWMNGKRPIILYNDLWSHVTGSGFLLHKLNLLRHWFSFVKIHEVYWKQLRIAIRYEFPFEFNKCILWVT